jgi:restriction system protein
VARSESLFQILLRQPWWVSLLVAVGVFALAHAIFPPVALFAALPFALLCGFIAFKQWRSGAGVSTGERLEALRGMDWERFSAVIADAYRRRGYAVHPAEAAGYDFRLTLAGRVTLVQCRRWKVNQVGVGPLRELVNAVEREDASHGICITAGEFSAPARALVASEPLTLVAGADLGDLVGPIRSTSPR